MPADLRVRAVAEVGAHSGTRIDGSPYLIGCRFRMADRDQDAAGRDLSDELRRIFVFGGDGEELDETFGRFLEALKFVPTGRANVLLGMGAARAIVGANERPLEMNAGNSCRNFGLFTDRLGDCGVSVPQNLVTIGRASREKAGDAELIL